MDFDCIFQKICLIVFYRYSFERSCWWQIVDMPKYAKEIVIRVFLKNSWPENPLFMAIIRRKKKRHGTITIKISRENKMENDKMNGWTKKRKVDTFMGILLQVYCFFPWMRINRKWNTIHMYVIKNFQENDYIKMYNHTFLKQYMWKWKHSQVVAFIFLLMLIFLILLQSID